MKKSTQLSLLTAGAVIATSAGTFAAWDNTKDTASFAAVTMDQINVTATVKTEMKATKTVGAAPTATGTFTVNAANISEADLGNSKMLFAPTVKEGDTVIDSENYDLVITDNGTAVTNGDADLAATNEYTVTVTPKETDAAKTAMANKEITVSIDATLEAK